MSLLGELERNRVTDDGVLRFITAGSVDDGKSTLIGRLLHDSQAILADQLAAVTRATEKRGQDGIDLSLLTDGLEAEREQGITIDVAYRYFATAKRKFIIADTPGHEQYTRNMATGASTAHAAVILIDARKGVLPQTRRHTIITRLLGIRHIVVAVNKMDLVGYDEAVFERIRADVLGFAAGLAITDLRFVPLSALAGDMVVERGAGLNWYRGPTLLETLEAIDVVDDAESLPLRFPVQMVVRPGAGTDYRGYAGRVEAGTIAPGDEVVVLPVGRRTRITEIRLQDEILPCAVAGDSVTVRLADDIDISRGDLISNAAQPARMARTLGARICWLDASPLDPAGRYLVKHTARTVRAKITDVRHRLDVHTLEQRPAAEVRMNDIVQVSIDLARPLLFDPYDVSRSTGAFILIDEATNHTVAAGMIDA
jgi:sulfate adenylyltransferase subunit 1